MPRVLRGLLFTVGLYNLLVWAYVVARVVLNDINPGDPFIDGIAISFWSLGIVTFVVGMACLALAAVSGRAGRESQRPEAMDERRAREV